MGKRITIRARVFDEAESRTITVRGQTARTLLALVAAGKRGATPLDVSGWAMRFSAYCFELRHRHGLIIETQREEHEGGWHGRHVLHSRVQILPTDAEAMGRAA